MNFLTTNKRPTYFILNFAVFFLFSGTVLAQCPPKGWSKQELHTLKINGWGVKDELQRQKIAISLLPCLGNSDPVLRDELAFEALSFWMRGNLLHTDTIEHIRLRLLATIQATNEEKNSEFSLPFSALALAEVSRVDRITPFLNDAQRNEMVHAAVQFLNTIKDYQGYDEKQGWRHNVAHGADWILQLALNSKITKTQHQSMLNALAQQINNEHHFYIYGESERLMNPVFYLAIRSSLTNEEWDAWFQDLLKTELDLSKTTQGSLARKHNLNAFLSSLYINLQETKLLELRQKLLPFVTQSLKKLN